MAGTAPVTHRQTVLGWRRALALSWIAYLTYYFPRLAFAVAKLGLLGDPAAPLSRAAMGVLDGLFLTLYALGQFVWGAAGVRLGPRILVPAGLVLAAGAAGLMAKAQTLSIFLVAMTIQGIAQSTGWPVLCLDVVRRVPATARGTAFGVLSTSYVAGGLIAPPLLGWFAYSVFATWRAAFLVAAGVALCVAALYWFATSEHGASTESSLTVKQPAGRAMLAALRDRDVQVLALADFLAKPALYAIQFWGPVMAAEWLRQGPVVATFVAAAFSLAGLAAPVVAGILSDRQGRRRPVVITGLLLCAVLLLILPFIAQTAQVLAVALGFFAIGLAFYGSESLLTGVAAAERGAANSDASAAVGVVNGVGSLGAILGGMLPGYVHGPALFNGLAVACAGAALLLVIAGRHAQA